MLTGLTGDLRTFLTTDSVALHRKPRLKEADLLYYETFMNVQQAVRREKQLKNWKIGWKLELIRRLNPDLKALQL
ncbi:hypothetical protein Y10_06580 [Neptunitalea sp. Y10]|uniref:Endonuclease n=2 Tax=Neptunitalea lumnitzerae TaxID=2965509 RepID=A0ABQ5MGY9_9FLAO|nr:hypothetical protein Y10_06580 [Neptunitalea sp. Y10]